MDATMQERLDDWLRYQNTGKEMSGPSGEENSVETSKDTAVDLKSLKTATFSLSVAEFSEFMAGCIELLGEKQKQYGPMEKRQTIDRMMEVDPLCPISQIIRYAERVVNKPEKAERDLMKIVTYAFFMWRSIRRHNAQTPPQG